MRKYNLMHNVGKAKYLVSYHDGVKTHKDGSGFFDIKMFKNKKALQLFINELENNGYIYSNH
jgi:hypothetical protein